MSKKTTPHGQAVAFPSGGRAAAGGGIVNTICNSRHKKVNICLKPELS